MDDVNAWEEQALDKHKEIKKTFFTGKTGIKSSQLEDMSIRMRIATHLLETGGGLTAREIEADAKATEGKEWRNTNTDGSPIVISEVLKDMIAPGSNMKRMLEAAGGFGIVDHSLAQEINKQYVLKETEGRYFLWCQDGIDWGARLSTAKSKLEAAQKEASQIDILNTETKACEARISALKTDLGELGFFKFSEKKTLKNKLESEEQELRTIKAKLNSAEKALKFIPQLTKDYEESSDKCKKTFKE